jgi:hypothetical protein
MADMLMMATAECLSFNVIPLFLAKKADEDFDWDVLYHSLCLYKSEQTFLPPMPSKIKIDFFIFSRLSHFSTLAGVLC